MRTYPFNPPSDNCIIILRNIALSSGLQVSAINIRGRIVLIEQCYCVFAVHDVIFIFLSHPSDARLAVTRNHLSFGLVGVRIGSLAHSRQSNLAIQTNS